MKYFLFLLFVIELAFSFLMLNRAVASYYVRFNDFKTASEIEPWNWSHHFQVGNRLLGASKPIEAIPYFRRANSMMPYHWGPVNNLAISYGMTGDLERGKRMIDELLRLFPGNPIITENKGIIQQFINEVDKHETR